MPTPRYTTVQVGWMNALSGLTLSHPEIQKWFRCLKPRDSSDEVQVRFVQHGRGFPYQIEGFTYEIRASRNKPFAPQSLNSLPRLTSDEYNASSSDFVQWRVTWEPVFRRLNLHDVLDGSQEDLTTANWSKFPARFKQDWASRQAEAMIILLTAVDEDLAVRTTQLASPALAWDALRPRFEGQHHIRPPPPLPPVWGQRAATPYITPQQHGLSPLVVQPYVPQHRAPTFPAPPYPAQQYWGPHSQQPQVPQPQHNTPQDLGHQWAPNGPIQHVSTNRATITDGQPMANGPNGLNGVNRQCIRPDTLQDAGSSTQLLSLPLTEERVRPTPELSSIPSQELEPRVHESEGSGSFNSQEVSCPDTVTGGLIAQAQDLGNLEDHGEELDFNELFDFDAAADVAFDAAADIGFDLFVDFDADRDSVEESL